VQVRQNKVPDCREISCRFDPIYAPTRATAPSPAVLAHLYANLLAVVGLEGSSRIAVLRPGKHAAARLQTNGSQQPMFVLV
jgi:hypothetical protein